MDFQFQLPAAGFVIKSALMVNFTMLEINGISIDTSAYDAAEKGVYIVDRARKIHYWNRAAEHITGYSADEVVGSSCSDGILNHINSRGVSICKGACPLSVTVITGKGRSSDLFLHNKAGHRMLVNVTASPLTDSTGSTAAVVEEFFELSIPEYVGLPDKDAGVPDRNGLKTAIGKLCAGGAAAKTSAGILVIVISNFNTIRDIYGKELSEEVMGMAGRTISFNSSASDISGRWGEDSVIVISCNISEDGLIEKGRVLQCLLDNSFIDLGQRVLPENADFSLSQKIVSISADVSFCLIADDDTPEGIEARIDEFSRQND